MRSIPRGLLHRALYSAVGWTIDAQTSDRTVIHGEDVPIKREKDCESVEGSSSLVLRGERDRERERERERAQEKKEKDPRIINAVHVCLRAI